jgi:hypothetical protein
MYLYSKLFVVDEKGEEIGIDRGIYSHHVVFMPSSRLGAEDFLNCNGRPVLTPQIPAFIGTSAEIFENRFGNANSTINTGFYIPKNDKIFVLVDFVNYKEYDQDVYLVPEVEYLPGKPAGYLDSSEFIVSPNTCDSIMGYNAGSLIRPPPGVEKFVVNGTDITFSKDGYIVWSRKFILGCWQGED